MTELWFWLWCRWTNHRGATFTVTEWENDQHVLSIFACSRCDRVPSDNVLEALDVIEEDLNRIEGTTGGDG